MSPTFEVGVWKTTLWRWQEYFPEAGVAGLLEGRSKPPGPKPLRAALKPGVVEKTVKAPGQGHALERAGPMAEEMGISHTGV